MRSWILATIGLGAVVVFVFGLPYVVVAHGLLGLTVDSRERYLIGVTALATVFLGAATFWLGWETRRLGSEEAEDRRLGIRPIIVFDHVPLQVLQPRTFLVSLRNVGGGSALECRYIAIGYWGANTGIPSAMMSGRFSLASGDSSKRPGGSEVTNPIGYADAAFRFFGHNPDGTDITETAGADPYVREVVICRDVLSGTWWFQREGKEATYSYGRGTVPGTHPEALHELPR